MTNHEKYLKRRKKALAYMKEYYKQNSVKIRKRVKKYEKENPEKIKALSKSYYDRLKADPLYFRKQYLKKKYNLTLKTLRGLIKAQEYKCPLCGCRISLSRWKFAIDHNHRTGKIRGILCRACNLGLGHFKDSISSLKFAIGYLKEKRN